MTRAIHRVLVVSHFFHPHVGGIEVVAGHQARRLADSGVAVEVLTTSCGSVPGVEVEDRVTVRRVRAWNVLERVGVPFPLTSPSLLWHGWRAVRRADLVHIHDALYLTSWAAAMLCRMLRTPYVVSRHVGEVYHPARAVRLVQALVNRTVGALVFDGARAILAIDAHVGGFSRAVAGEDSTVRVLSNATDVDAFRPCADELERHEIRSRYDLPWDESLVLFVGRLVPKKNFELVAAAANDGYRVVFVGGDRPEHVSDPRLTFLGRLGAEEVAEIYRACDLFIGASVGEAPLTVREAMASGTPVLLNEDPAYRALGIDDRIATFTPMTSPRLLRRVLASSLADTEALRKRAVLGRELAIETFSWETHMRSLLASYADAVRVAPAQRGAVEASLDSTR